jgi:hypothetical protein
VPEVNQFFLILVSASFVLLAGAMAYASAVASGDDRK